MGLKITDIVDFRLSPVGTTEEHFYLDFIDKNKELTRIEVVFKKGYSPFKEDNMNTKWLKEKQSLNLSKIYKDLMKPQELHNDRYF